MIITFLGHRSLYNCEDLSKKVEKTIIENINPNYNTQFYCGGFGGAYNGMLYAKRKKKRIINLAEQT